MFRGRPAAACDGILHVTAISFETHKEIPTNRLGRGTSRRGCALQYEFIEFDRFWSFFSISEGSIAMWWCCLESKQKDLGVAESSSLLKNRK